MISPIILVQSVLSKYVHLSIRFSPFSTVIFFFVNNPKFCCNLQKDKKTGKPKIWLYRNKETGESKGEATITYDDSNAAKSAISWFDNKNFNGSTIHVSLAQRQNNWQKGGGNFRGGSGGRGGGGGGGNRDGGGGRFGGGGPRNDDRRGPSNGTIK